MLDSRLMLNSRLVRSDIVHLMLQAEQALAVQKQSVTVPATVCIAQALQDSHCLVRAACQYAPLPAGRRSGGDFAYDTLCCFQHCSTVVELKLPPQKPYLINDAQNR